MHELSITEGILKLALEKAGEAGAKKITGINLVIGDLSGIVGECVQFYFDFLSRGTPAQGADLACRMVTPKARCRDCSQEFPLQELNWACRNCGGNRLEIIAGQELFVESIEVD